MTAPDRVRVCFVCLGNICRSPTAEAVMRHRVREAGLEGVIEVESAGTGSWHVGHPPDARAEAEARSRGIAMAGAAQQFGPSDFGRFDLVLAMDRENAAHLRRIAPDAEAAGRVRLLREFDPGASGGDLSVPDPYYGGPEGFSTVFELVDAACRGLIDHLRR
ncbi:MAG TPA: low molecular weight protein-tyrosine-phosphatase [Miltoncostaeaceae bacterium]|nr:low molecular weight protein-tyrosine-phosphatase [Miltoncostaeaceae bacterium]